MRWECIASALLAISATLWIDAASLPLDAHVGTNRSALSPLDVVTGHLCNFMGVCNNTNQHEIAMKGPASTLVGRFTLRACW